MFLQLDFGSATHSPDGTICGGRRKRSDIFLFLSHERVEERAFETGMRAWFRMGVLSRPILLRMVLDGVESRMNNGFPVYSPEDVRRLLDYGGCINAVREAMWRFSRDGNPQPLRSIYELEHAKLFGIMPGTLSAPDGFGAKIISVFEDPDHPGRAAHRGLIVLFRRGDGEVACIADAEEITKIRTAAASAVATDALARLDAKCLALFGCGAQAESHLRAISQVRRLEQVLIWGRSPKSAHDFASRMAAETNLVIRAIESAEEAASNADIICTVTSSQTPVLFGKWVRPGTHVNAVGSSRSGPIEVDQALVVKSRYIADSRRSALAAASEFLAARDAGLIRDDHIVAEIGEVLLGRICGRTSADEITFYKALGHIVQDLAAVTYIHQHAMKK
jgi:ornithine cyclodeaminase